MRWTRGFVGIVSVLACAATAHASELDVSCDRQHRAFVVRPLVEDDAHFVLVGPQRVPTIEIEAVRATRLVFSLSEDDRSGWSALKSLLFAATPLSLLDVAGAVADLARVVADIPPSEQALSFEVTLLNIDGDLYTRWAMIDEPASGVQLLRVAPGWDVSAAFNP